MRILSHRGCKYAHIDTALDAIDRYKYNGESVPDNQGSPPATPEELLPDEEVIQEYASEEHFPSPPPSSPPPPWEEVDWHVELDEYQRGLHGRGASPTPSPSPSEQVEQAMDLEQWMVQQDVAETQLPPDY